MKIFFAAFGTGAEFLDALETGAEGNETSLTVDTKARFDDERVILEIGFPGLDNRVLVRAAVGDATDTAQTFTFSDGEEHKRDFLIAVASGKAKTSWGRRHRRFPMRVKAHFKVDGEGATEGEGQIEEIGAGGASITTEEPLPDGAKVAVVLEGSEGDEPIEFSGVVVWSEKGDASAGIGIQFDRLGGDEMKQLRWMIRDVKTSGKTVEDDD